MQAVYSHESPFVAHIQCLYVIILQNHVTAKCLCWYVCQSHV